MVAFISALFSYAKDSLYAVGHAMTSIVEAIAKRSRQKPSQDELFSSSERKITLGQGFSGTGKKVANVWHPFSQSNKSASSSANSRSIMTRLAFRVNYKAAG